MQILVRGLVALAMLALVGCGVATSQFIAAPEVQVQVSAEQAIQHVIQRSNEEQVHAIAERDPAQATDTMTAAHAAELTAINQSLLRSGVSTIALLDLDWGDVLVDGTNATATTTETWRTTYSTGIVEQSRDRNDYSLVLEGGAWKIHANEHPETGQAARGTQPVPQRPVPADPGIPDGQNVSHNWSGYAATGGTFTAVSGTWTVPAFNPDGAFGLDAAWVGIGGVRTRDLIQAGTSQTVSGTGSTQFQAWVETLPEAARPVPLSVHPGDSVSVSITEQARNSWLVSIVNNSTGKSYQETLLYQSSRSSAEWVEEAPSSGRGLLPLADFGRVEFTGGSAVRDGQTMTIAETGARAITMLGSQNQALAVPSALGADGASFSVARTEAPVTAQPSGGRRGR